MHYYIYFLLYVVSFFVFVLIFYSRKTSSTQLNILDIPDLNRKKHKKPTPLIGGFQIIFFLSIFFLIDKFVAEILNINFKIYLFSLIIFFVGFIDDRNNLSGYIKIFTIYTITLFFLLNSDDLVLNELYFSTFDKIFSLNSYNIFITSFFILILINAFNLSDGINGLAVGIAIIWLIYLNFIFFSKIDLFMMSLIFFLIINFYYIYNGYYFLGDSGSLLLSSFIGLLTINNYATLDLESNLIPVEKIFILFMIPGIDMARVFLIRVFKKKKPFHGDRIHFHHLLIDKFSLKKSLMIYFLTIIIPLLLMELANISYLVIIILYSILFIAVSLLLNNKKII